MAKDVFDDVAGVVFEVEDELGHRAITTKAGRMLLRQRGIHSHSIPNMTPDEAELVMERLRVGKDDYYYDWTTGLMFTRVPFSVLERQEQTS